MGVSDILGFSDNAIRLFKIGRKKDRKYLKHLNKHSHYDPVDRCEYCDEQIKWDLERIIRK